MSGSTSHVSAPTSHSQDPVHLRRTDTNERFVAFAFAGADMVVETDADGTVTYAAGAFRGKFTRPPEAFVGRPLRELIAPVDHDALEAALSLLAVRGRLAPLIIRLSDAPRTRLALGGMALAPQGRPLRLCLSFAQPPASLASMRRTGTPHALARVTEARLRAGTPCDLGLLEIVGDTSVMMSSREAIGQAVEAVAPDALAGELAPGRFGLLGPGGTNTDLLSIASLLQSTLHSQGVEVSIAARHLPLAGEGLNPIQAARALRQALNVFARDGIEGLGAAGLDGGLAGYMRRADAQAISVRQAIRGGHFSMVFQPIVALVDRATHHYEMLIRPEPLSDGSRAAPQDFIMLVEALGLADELDYVVGRLACEAAIKAGVLVAFNLSGQSVQNGNFRPRLMRLLAASPARKAGLIMVEMTETAEIEDVEEAALTVAALRSLGIAFCLDDFGAGATDIRLLRALTPDVVKLDGSYIPGVAEDGRERAFVSGMVEIARASGAEIVAERVETEAEADALRSLGVHYGQGWLFGRPGPLPHKAAPSGQKVWRA